ncbi:Hypothetical_protein [Hexamita inflata]|uniref:Hypothetical_protein n=1 Tax=Hexamita inflata TaxID=28002 RepID=A0AA86RJ99_9EUKA|nr:Hypothetical protein HINF_LOCUS66650 [Hexamita inflata]
MVRIPLFVFLLLLGTEMNKSNLKELKVWMYQFNLKNTNTFEYCLQINVKELILEVKQFVVFGKLGQYKSKILKVFELKLKSKQLISRNCKRTERYFVDLYQFSGRLFRSRPRIRSGGSVSCLFGQKLLLHQQFALQRVKLRQLLEFSGQISRIVQKGFVRQLRELL